MPGGSGDLDKRVAESIDAFVERVKDRGYSDEVADLIRRAYNGDASALDDLAKRIAPDDDVREHLLKSMGKPGDNSVYLGIALGLYHNTPIDNQSHLSTLHCILQTLPPGSRV